MYSQFCLYFLRRMSFHLVQALRPATTGCLPFPIMPCPAPPPSPALLISPTLLQFLFSVSQSTRHLCVGPISSFCFLRLRPFFRSSKEAGVIVLFTDAVCLAHSRGSINTSGGRRQMGKSDKCRKEGRKERREEA